MSASSCWLDPLSLEAGYSGGNTGYTPAMAKVMVSLPDDLLEAVDAEAVRRGTTRSGLLRRFADEALRRRGAARAAQIEEIMRDSADHGGDVARVLKHHRPRR